MEKLASLTLVSILSYSGLTDNPTNTNYNLERESIYESNQFDRGERIFSGELYWSRLIIIKRIPRTAVC